MRGPRKCGDPRERAGPAKGKSGVRSFCPRSPRASVALLDLRSHMAGPAACAYVPYPHAESSGPSEQTLPEGPLRVAAAGGRSSLLETFSPGGHRGGLLPRYGKVKSQMFD